MEQERKVGGYRNGKRGGSDRKLSEQQYEAIKTVLNSKADFTQTQISKMFGVTQTLVSEIKRSASYEDMYIQRQAAKKLAASKRAAKKKGTEPITASEALEHVQTKNYDFTEAQLDCILDELKEISKQLAQVVTMMGVPPETKAEEEPRRSIFSFSKKPF